MRTIQLLEALLEELDAMETIEEVRTLVEEMIDEEYERQGVADVQDDLKDEDDFLH